ncbi:hypothetical protein BH11ACT8_BH11ACT8_32400 [soil metagenome]
MTSTLDPLDADEVYASMLEPRRRSRTRRLLVSALDLWCATTGGRMELTRAADVVVRRRSDGVEELRVPVPAADDAPLILDVVREQLESLSPDEFRAAWGIA